MKTDKERKRIQVERFFKLGFQTVVRGWNKVLCPLTGPIETWEYGREVYVSNLPPHITEHELYSKLIVHGKICQIRMANSEKRDASKNYAYVLYSTTSEALNAVKNGDTTVMKYLMGSWKVQVTLSIDNRRIFVRNYPEYWTASDMEALASSCLAGFVRVVFFKKEFCFLEFKNYETAMICKDLIRQILKERFGEKIIVNWARPLPIVDPKIMQKVKTLFIRGLAWEINEVDLQIAIVELMHEQGIFRQWVHVKKDKDFAFVSFETKEVAVLVFYFLQGRMILGKRVTVDWARPSDPALLIMPGKVPRRQQNLAYAGAFVPDTDGLASVLASAISEPEKNMKQSYAQSGWENQPKYQAQDPYVVGNLYNGKKILNGIEDVVSDIGLLNFQVVQPSTAYGTHEMDYLHFFNWGYENNDISKLIKLI